MAHLVSQKNQKVLVVYVNVPKLIDARLIAETGTELLDMMNRAEHNMLLVNFQQVVFMSSAMLSKLLALHKQCKANKVTLKLSNLSKDILEVFAVTNLNKLFEIYADEADAMKAFEKKGWFL